MGIWAPGASLRLFFKHGLSERFPFLGEDGLYQVQDSLSVFVNIFSAAG